MKRTSFLFTTLFLIAQATSFAQKFEIPQVDNTVFYDIIEWKGMGALLMSKDANSSTKQITLTLVNEQQRSVWDQKFNPKTDDFYYISSDNARYVYFLDNLELQDGKVYFSQLNSAGNIKSTNVSIISAVKKLKNLSSDDLDLVNVVVTDKALVHHFRYTDKTSKR